MSALKLTEAEKEALAKKQEEERIIKEEKARTTLEQYKCSEIGSWAVLPGILLFLLIAAAVLDLCFISKQYNPYIVIPAGIIGGMIVVTSNIEEHWKKRLECKKKIHDEDYKYEWTKYDYDCIYTDSILIYWAYQISKIGLCLLSVAAGLILIILMFMWIGGLAPTTIIIILLVMILLK